MSRQFFFRKDVDQKQVNLALKVKGGELDDVHIFFIGAIDPYAIRGVKNGFLKRCFFLEKGSHIH